MHWFVVRFITLAILSGICIFSVVLILIVITNGIEAKKQAKPIAIRVIAIILFTLAAIGLFLLYFSDWLNVPMG